MSFGSSSNDPNEMTRQEEIAAYVRSKSATVEGVHQMLQVQAQQIETIRQDVAGLHMAYKTLREEFSQFQAARHRELSMKVNGGSTTPEDDGLMDR
jgi:hypothetical protein